MKPLYALSLDPAPRQVGESHLSLRLVLADGKHVVLFTDESLATEWVKENMPRNAVISPFVLTEEQVVGFLDSLRESGDTHVCLNPSKTSGSFLDLKKFLDLLGRPD